MAAGVVADEYRIAAVEGDAAALAAVGGGIHELHLPARAVEISVLEGIVADVAVADLGPVGAVERQAVVPAYVAAAIHNGATPIGAIPGSITQAGAIVVGSMQDVILVEGEIIAGVAGHVFGNDRRCPTICHAACVQQFAGEDVVVEDMSLLARWV